jgi:hypothetical protein
MKSCIIIVASMVLPLVGCQSAPVPSAGMAALRVKVIAEPKAGAPAESVAAYDASPVSAASGFERVDYSSLDEIVVWAEPADTGPTAQPPVATVSIDVDARKPAPSLSAAACVGQRVLVRNGGSRPVSFYSVSDGNEVDLGLIPPGGQAEYAVRSAGLIEVLCDSSKDPVALVYAAPTRWFALARAGRSVEFNDLPPGRWKICSWHPRLPGHETVVVLVPNQAATASIKVGVNGLPLVQPR